MVREKDINCKVVGLDSNYMCPNSSGCLKTFDTLGALFNHLESKSCGYDMDCDAILEAGRAVFHSKSILFH
jgi:hypothetical protein